MKADGLVPGVGVDLDNNSSKELTDEEAVLCKLATKPTFTCALAPSGVSDIVSDL